MRRSRGRGADRTGGDGSSRAAVEVRLPGRRHSDHSRLGAWRAEWRSQVGGQDRRADGRGGLVCAAARARGQPALPDADRGHLLDLGTRNCGHGTHRARQDQGGRGLRDRRLPRDAQDGLHRRRDVQEAAG